jgi:hypothetical protein
LTPFLRKSVMSFSTVAASVRLRKLVPLAEISSMPTCT